MIVKLWPHVWKPGKTSQTLSFSFTISELTHLHLSAVFPTHCSEILSKVCFCIYSEEHVCYRVCERSRPELCERDSCWKCVPQPVALFSHQHKKSATSRLVSPSSRITTWCSDSGCCPSWPPSQTLLPYLLTPSSHIPCSKCQNLSRWVFDFCLFMWCFSFLTPWLLKTFQNILYI